MYSSSLAQIWILLILLHVSCCNSDDRPLVHTKYGPILGKRVRMHQYNPNLQDVMQFLGIPYARAPVKDLRFRPPEKPEKWKIVRNCTHFAPVCPQPLDLPESQPVRPSMKRKWKAMKPLLGSMDEDCLYLNVYHPADVDPENIDKKERYPLAVMVFVHGGDFVHGAGSMYDGSVLASHGTVVVVTVNYRMGILGYLSTTDNSAVGNYALMDQIAALRWVNDNIANFKGDPTRVTLFGPETGAVNINLLTLAPEAAGLFRRAILQGGSAIASWSLSPDPRRFSNLLAENVSCCRPNTTLGVECLRTIPWRDLLAVEISSPNPFKSTFGPIIDGDVVPDNPKTLMRGELFRSYDILVGVTEQDGYKYVEDFPGVDEGIDDEGFRLIIGDFVNQVYPYRENEIQDAVAFMYTNWGEENNRTRRDGVVRMFTEHQVAVPLIILGNLHSNENYETSTYFYTFNHRPSSSPNPPWVEAAHSEDMPFVFGAPLVGLRIYRDSNYTKSEIMLSAAIMTYWTNFAKSGDPNSPIVQKTRFVHERPNRYEEVEWLSYRADNDSDFYMYFGMKPRVPKGYRSQRVAFWVELVPKLLRPKQVRNSESALVKDANELCELLETGHNTGGDGDGAGKKPSSWIPMKSHSDTVRTTCMPFIAIPTRDPSAKDISWPGKDITWVRKKPGNSSELSIVIAVGTSLFFLNVVVFAVCYHRRNNKPIRYSEENAQERVRLKVTDVREVIKALELEDCTIGPNGECQLETTELAECSSKVI
ncbi:neuroligin-4, X-linked-like isoform X1 [Branchiostoma floridae]|uniref:Neuroligin-4, X-linked-like isoform X1 n=2 Tax=Branchiostoma floridae TaxID=7739 RepID=A0A9J7M2N5_BRAFL|nr:neuroligin-4, X-linked-like isoform X1 [Branchiostoma floridae]XP_035693611.1 neuroligin-4, X-linked-like isoform X1 [Branchiostoma floridae]